MRERKKALHTELRRYVSLRKFRRYATKALEQAREEAKEAKRAAKQREWDNLDDQEQINQLLRDDTDGVVSIRERPNDEGWTLTWFVLTNHPPLTSCILHLRKLTIHRLSSPVALNRGNLELSKKKVAELAAEVERVTAEWQGGKIVRGDDGVFRASFDPGNLYSDWLSKWCDPSHYSHAGRYPYPTVQQQQQQQQQQHGRVRVSSCV